MALFKFRKSGDEPVAAGAPQPESVEALRRRARHRLIGAVVLVLAGVAGFPLLFDTQPRPISVDIPIEIPDRNKARPLPVPVAPAARPVASAAAAPPPSAPVAAAVPSPAPAPAPVAAKLEPAAPQQQAKAEPKPEPRAEAKPPAPAPRVDEAAKAQALLEGRTVPAAEGRFVVQVGAFSDTGKAQETRRKVERAGLKTYTQVAETRDGKRIRVRVGPFATRADADKAAQKIKGLDLPAAILTL